MIPFNNYIFITIDKMFEDKIVSPEKNLELELASFSQDIVDKNDIEIYNVRKKRINYGNVVGVPRHLTSSVLLVQKDPGLPMPEVYIDHDTVVKCGPKIVQYQCGLYKPTWKTLADVSPDVELNDRVYFHFNTLDDENKINPLTGDKLYKLAYQNALCVVREGEIIPVSGHVLIEPLYDSDVVDIETMKVKMSRSGLITETNIKPTYLKGIVRFISKPLMGDKIYFKERDIIIYFPNADWEVNIEGKIYYVMKYWDVLATCE